MNYKDTKLIAFLRTFTPEELSDFEKFIVSPYFKKGRDLMPFFKVLLKHHTDYNSENFNEELIFDELYPGTGFGDKKSKDILKTLSSSLLKLAEEFIVISKFRKNNVLRNRIMLDEILNRDLVKYYEQYREITADELGVKGKATMQNILEEYFFEGMNSRYCSQILDYKNYFKHVIRSGEFISSYFISNLLRIAKTKYLSETGRNLKSEKDIVDFLTGALDMKAILKIYEKTPHYVFMGYHYYTYLSLTNNCDIKYYKSAKEIFFGNKSKLSNSERLYLYSDLLNILNMSFQMKNSSDNRKEIFELLKSCIEDKAYKFSEDDFMQPDFYRNVILNAVYLKEFDWALDFTDNYTKELKHEFRENLKYYSRTMIFFGKKEFEEALVNISKVKYDLVNFKIDVKIISLMIFFELQMTEQAYSMTDTFKHFLRSFKELPEELRVSHLNFIKYYLKILNINVSGKKDEVLFFRSKIENEKLVSHKKWLLEKLGDL